jgi:hypothetical protein
MEERMAELADFYPARLARAGAVAEEAVAAGTYADIGRQRDAQRALNAVYAALRTPLVSTAGRDSSLCSE